MNLPYIYLLTFIEGTSGSTTQRRSCTIHRNSSKRRRKVLELPLHQKFDQDQVHEALEILRQECLGLFIKNEVNQKLSSEKDRGPTEIRTRIVGFKVQSDSHYTIRIN